MLKSSKVFTAKSFMTFFSDHNRVKLVQKIYLQNSFLENVKEMSVLKSENMVWGKNINNSIAVS